MTLLAAAATGTPTPGAPRMNTLNTIPTYDGSGLSIHPSVVDMGAGEWNGYRWWLADTPYPAKNDDYENPSIFGSHDRVTWEVPAGLTNPIAPAPVDPSKWNADTELLWDADNSRMVCFWRTNGIGNYLMAAHSTDGVTWTTLDPPPLDYDASGASPLRPWTAPTITQGPDGTWRKLTFDLDTEPRLWTTTNLLGSWTPGAITTWTGPAFEKWHGKILFHDGVYFGLIASRFENKMRPMASLDCAAWHIGDTDLLWGVDVYRPTLIPSTVAGMMDVWYSTLATQRVTYTRLPMSTFLDLIPA